MIDTGAGVIDADYRGEVKVLLFNLSQTDFEGAPTLFSQARVQLCKRVVVIPTAHAARTPLTTRLRLIALSITSFSCFSHLHHSQAR